MDSLMILNLMMDTSGLFPQLGNTASGGKHLGTNAIAVRDDALQVNLEPVVVIPLVAEKLVGSIQREQ
ncbi:MAG: hypothetical protein AB4368_16025 [Xenococcaceae cyanobacterium]